MLTQADVVGYLLERRLLEPSAIVDGTVTVADASRRNRNFLVESDGPAFLVKQGLGPVAAGTVAHEAAVYERLAARPALREIVPEFHGYDPAAGVLVLGLIRDAEDLRAYHERIGSFPAETGQAVGDALATLHVATRARYPDAVAPWILSIHRPDVEIFRDSSAATLALIKVVQAAPELGERLDRLRAEWSVETLIHQDVKWDNFLVSGAGETVRLVDWELGTAGDPCWDLGSALSQYLSAWLFSIPVTGTEPPQRFPALAQFPLDAMKAALRACWAGYEAHAGRIDDAVLAKTLGYAGARLIQTALEASQLGQQLTSAAVLHLQLAANVLARPADAGLKLLELRGVPAA